MAMNKKLIGVLFLVGILSASLVFAHSGLGFRNNNYLMHEQFETVIEEGLYNELEQLRNETGFNMMPLIQSQEDLELVQNMHENIEEYSKQQEYNSFVGRGGCHGMRGFY